MPDSSLSLYGFDVPFIVCEVAVSQTLKSVMEKKRPYLLGSKNKIRFLIIIYLASKLPTNSLGKRVRPCNSASAALDENEVGDSATSPYKAGYVFVYTTTIQRSEKDPTRRVRSIKTVVANLVCPLPCSTYQAVCS